MDPLHSNAAGSNKSPRHVTKAQWVAVAILTYVNLINYMDRYTIAGKIITRICLLAKDAKYLLQ